MASQNFHSEGLPLLESAVVTITIFFPGMKDEVYYPARGFLGIPLCVVLLISQMFFGADTELLNGLVLRFKEQGVETMEAEEKRISLKDLLTSLCSY